MWSYDVVLWCDVAKATGLQRGAAFEYVRFWADLAVQQHKACLRGAGPKWAVRGSSGRVEGVAERIGIALAWALSLKRALEQLFPTGWWSGRFIDRSQIALLCLGHGGAFTDATEIRASREGG